DFGNPENIDNQISFMNYLNFHGSENITKNDLTNEQLNRIKDIGGKIVKLTKASIDYPANPTAYEAYELFIKKKIKPGDWPIGEEKISTNSLISYYYAVNIIKGPFP